MVVLALTELTLEEKMPTGVNHRNDVEAVSWTDWPADAASQRAVASVFA